MSKRSAPLLLLLALAACGGAAEDAEPAAESGMEMTAGPRVSGPPTAEGELPSAIIGEGGPLEGTDLRYYPADSSAVGYLAVPDGEGPFPALVIIHEWNGLVDRVRQIADDFAAEGYVTLAADL